MKGRNTNTSYPHRFVGKSVVITGASRGIGVGIARRFGAEGARVYLCSNEEAVLRVAEEFRGSGEWMRPGLCAT